MVMGSLFSEASTTIQDAQDEEKRRQEQGQQLPDPLRPPPAIDTMLPGNQAQSDMYTPTPPQQGDPYVDAPTGSLRATLESNRQGDSQYGGLPGAAADAGLSAYGSINPQVPYADKVRDAFSQAAQNTVGGFLPPAAGPGGLPQQNPYAAPIGQAVGGLVPTGAADIALAALPMAGEGADALRGLRTSAENYATDPLRTVSRAPETVGLRDPYASGMQEVLAGNGGGAIPPQGGPNFNFNDAAAAERVPPAVDPLRPPDPLQRAYQAGIEDVGKGYGAAHPLDPPAYDGVSVDPDQAARLQSYRQGILDASGGQTPEWFNRPASTGGEVGGTSPPYGPNASPPAPSGLVDTQGRPLSSASSDASFDALKANNIAARTPEDIAGVPGINDFAAQRAARAETPYNADGSGGPPSQNGGNAPPPRPPAPAGLDGNVWHNALDLIGAPTRPLLMGLHTARFAPQEVMRPSVLGNGINALGEVLLRGHARDVIAHVNELGPNIPAGLRAADMKLAAGAPRVRPTYVAKAINDIPVLGPVLERLGDSNSTMLGVMRDAHYNTAADRLARTVPDATPAMYKDLWREANNATGHTTLPGLKGNSVAGGMGIGWGALGARVQELGNTIIGSGAPLPFAAAGSRAEAFKTLMGVAATMAGTTALAKALGADVNLNKPFNSFGMESTFLRPVTSNGLSKTIYGTGGAGYDTLFRAAANIGNDLFNGDEAKALQHALSFGRGEFGVVPSAVIDGILGKDWKGDPYSWKNFIDEAKTGFMANAEGKWGEGRSVPISAGENIKAVQAYGPEGLLRALPADIASSVQTAPLTSKSSAFQYGAPPDILQKSFHDEKMQAILKGKDWAELLPNEQAQITQVLRTEKPELAKQVQDEYEKKYPAFAAHQDSVAHLQALKTGVEDSLLADYKSGKMDLPHLKNAYQAAERYYYSGKDKANSDPAYKAAVDKLQKDMKDSGQNPTAAQNAVDAFYEIGSKFDNKADRQAAQSRFIDAIAAKDPALAYRVLNAARPANQTELEKMYASGALNGAR